jgi:hypothetical protein
MHLHLLSNSAALKWNYADIEATCVAQSLLLDTEYSMMFMLSTLVFWMSS